MKAAVLVGKQQLEIWDVPKPEIGDKEVLVRLKACSVCNGTDSKLYKGSHALVKYPAVIGHEAAGIVEAVGKDVTKLKVGDWVIGGGYPGTPELASLWGQYCEYGVTNEDFPVKIPDNVPIEEATLSIMLSEALNALRVGDIRPGDHILILGAGAVGFSILSMLKHTFPAVIIVVDINEEKLKIASKLGADAVLNANDEKLADKINEITKGKGINKLIEAVGSQQTYNIAFDLIAKNGIIVSFGMMESSLEIPFRTLYSKQAQIRWCCNEGGNAKETRAIVLDMMHKGLIDPSTLITSRIPLDNVTDAFEKIAAGTEIRVVLQL